jgi:predicted nucleic acid-binding protein
MASTEPPEQRAGILCVDTSALLKLLVREAESSAIERELLQWPNLATTIITEVELPRAVTRARQERPDAAIDGSLILQGILAAAEIIPLSDEIVAAAEASRRSTSELWMRSISPARSASIKSSPA